MICNECETVAHCTSHGCIPKTTTTSRRTEMSKEALKLALDKVQEFKSRWCKVPPFADKVNKATREAITLTHMPIFELELALREALAEQPAQQQEPVAQWQKKHPARTDGKWENTNEHDAKWWRDNAKGWEIRALYKPPPAQRQARSADTWVNLTHDEYDAICDKHSTMSDFNFLADIEAKLKEKNT